MRSKALAFSKKGLGIAATLTIGIFTIFFINNSFNTQVRNKSANDMTTATAMVKSNEDGATSDSKAVENPVTGFSAKDADVTSRKETKEDTAPSMKISPTMDNNIKQSEGKAESEPPKSPQAESEPVNPKSRIAQGDGGNADKGSASEANGGPEESSVQSFGYLLVSPCDTVTITTEDTKTAKSKIKAKVLELKGKIENSTEDPNSKRLELRISIEKSKKTIFIDYLKSIFKKENITIDSPTTNNDSQTSIINIFIIN